MMWYTEQMNEVIPLFITGCQSSKASMFSVFSCWPYEKYLWSKTSVDSVREKCKFTERTYFNNINTTCSPIWLFLLDKVVSYTESLEGPLLQMQTFKGAILHVKWQPVVILSVSLTSPLSAFRDKVHIYNALPDIRETREMRASH